MSELLFEILSEEIPARMQTNAANQLKQLFTDAINKSAVTATKIETYVTPRRLVLYADNLVVATNQEQEIRGPRTDGPQAAIDGFAVKYNKTIDELEVRTTDKGSFYFLVNKPKNINLDLELSNILNKIMQDFSWPKSMRWGGKSQYWVRPIRNILCLYDGKVLPVEYAGIKANRKTQGHRFLSSDYFEVRYFNDFKENLHKRYVVLDSKERENIIKFEIEKAIHQLRLHCKFEQSLVNEVVGLVEWPKIIVGEFEKKFLRIPHQIIELTIKTHQRYFPLYDQNDELANKFIVVANTKQDKSGLVVKGNQKVVKARLADASYFYDQDLKISLAEHSKKLARLTFHKQLGGMDDKANRMANLAIFIACWIPYANLEQVEKAAKIAKADLVTNIVSEFPELQGAVGAHYAACQQEDENIITAIAEHYLPIGPETRCPTNPIAITTALADKIDSLVGFFAINEKPTSSKDPYALRRAAIGIIRIIVENEIAIPLKAVLETAYSFLPNKYKDDDYPDKTEVIEEVTSFIMERFRFYHKTLQTRHDIFEAVVSTATSCDLYYLSQKINFLSTMIEHESFAKIYAAFVRIEKIIAANNSEEKISNKISEKHLYEDAEQELFSVFSNVQKEHKEACQTKNLEQIWLLLAKLVDPINSFFDNVMVNVDDQKVKNNRLGLLSQILELSKEIADLSKVTNI